MVLNPGWPPKEALEIDVPDTRWWVPWADRRATRRQLRALWRAHLEQVDATSVGLSNLRRDMTSSEDRAYARAAEVVGLLRAEFASLRSQIDAAVADKDAAVQAGVQAALADDSATDAARVEGLITELESVLPREVPQVPIPQPGEAAVLPETGGDEPPAA